MIWDTLQATYDFNAMITALRFGAMRFRYRLKGMQNTVVKDKPIAGKAAKPTLASARPKVCHRSYRADQAKIDNTRRAWFQIQVI